MTAKLSPLQARRTRQPPAPTGVDWSNPLALGLQVLFDGARCRDAVSNRPFAPRHPTAGRAGMGHQVDGETTVAQLANHVFTVGSGVTIFVLVDHQTIAGGTYKFLCGRGTYGLSTDTSLGFSDINELYLDYAGGASEPLGTARSAGLHSYAVASDGSNVIAYIDGTVSGTAAATTYISGGAQPMLIGCGTSDYLSENVLGKYLLIAWWNRVLTASEFKALHNNPWQLFEPEFIPSFTPVVTAQYARPTSDVSAGTWTASTGSDLFAMLDETVADDGDYITTTNASTCEVALGSLTDPALSTGHIVRYRISSASGGITVRLRQGTTTIATWTHASAPSSLTTYEQTLTGGEADSITDYSALRLQFEAT